MTGGHHFVHLSVQKGALGGSGAWTSLSGQWQDWGNGGAPPFFGSVDKLIDFIFVSNATPNPYWPDIHMFYVQRRLLPSSVALFFLLQFLSLSPPPHFFYHFLALSLFISLFRSGPSFTPFEASILNLARPCPSRGWHSSCGRLVGGKSSPCFPGHSSG